jgi:Rieske Fe-S protein
MTDVVSRRIVFQGLGALGVAVALAACGVSDDDGGDSDNALEPGATLATTDEVPIGGGIILSDERVVITQPTEGEFKAFTAVCTHQANTVTSVENGTILCSFHGSSFSAETGAVEGGPAPAPLAGVPITVEGNQIVAA